jgi:hypothetical protein
MRLWTIIKALADKSKKCTCQQYTKLTQDDIGIPIHLYIKIKGAHCPYCQKHHANKYLPQRED